MIYSSFRFLGQASCSIYAVLYLNACAYRRLDNFSYLRAKIAKKTCFYSVNSTAPQIMLHENFLVVAFIVEGFYNKLMVI